MVSIKESENVTEPDETSLLLKRAAQQLTAAGLDSQTRAKRLFLLGWGRLLNTSSEFVLAQRQAGFLSDEEIAKIMQLNIEVAQQMLTITSEPAG